MSNRTANNLSTYKKSAHILISFLYLLYDFFFSHSSVDVNLVNISR